MTNAEESALVPAPTSAVQHQPQETATAQASAMARAEVEARYLMAERHPRNEDAVRTRLLKECDRGSFAQVALYSVPRAGRKIEGLSIRFAEAARRLAGNMITTVQTIYQDDEQQILRVVACDFETNAIDVEEVTVPRYKESRSPQGEVVGSRMNSTGQTVYRVRTTDDHHRTKRRSETQRAKRNAILALLPGDLLDECKERVKATLERDIKADPDAYRKQICDSFASINVPVEELRDYLGHDLMSASPAEFAELGAVFQTVRAGEASWRDCLAAKTGVVGDGKKDPNKGLKDKIAKKAAEGARKRGAKAAKPKGGKKDENPAAASEPSKPGAVPPEDEPPMREPGEEG